MSTFSASVIGKAKNGTVHVFEPGDDVPKDAEAAGIDVERMERLGLIGDRPDGEPEHGTTVSEVPAERPASRRDQRPNR